MGHDYRCGVRTDVACFDYDPRDSISSVEDKFNDWLDKLVRDVPPGLERAINGVSFFEVSSTSANKSIIYNVTSITYPTE